MYLEALAICCMTLLCSCRHCHAQHSGDTGDDGSALHLSNFSSCIARSVCSSCGTDRAHAPRASRAIRTSLAAAWTIVLTMSSARSATEPTALASTDSALPPGCEMARVRARTEARGPTSERGLAQAFLAGSQRARGPLGRAACARLRSRQQLIQSPSSGAGSVYRSSCAPKLTRHPTRPV
jgi:hypothetical protein